VTGGEVTAEGLPADVVRGEGVLVIVPTYQERLNVESIVARVRASVPMAHVLVVDDASPDGTGALADALAVTDGHVHVLHRAAKNGLGAAYLAGFEWGLARDYEVLVEMDAAGSHPPEQLPRLQVALPEAALVLGSRWERGGSVVNWPARRRALSQGGNVYVRKALGIGVHDATGGYRAFRRSTLEKLDLAGVASHGYCFQVDLVWRTVQQGLRVTEVPIEFVERVRGDSKMNGAIVREALWRVTVWAARERAKRLPAGSPARKD
jgi:glycosyltransferase involved in cell wall biosynthesis